MSNKEQIEEWRDIEGYEGLYQVSNIGRVRSLDAIKECFSKCGNRYKSVHHGKILKPYPQAGGYLTVTLYKYGVPEYQFVHRLVASTFLENTKNHGIVSFIDGNKYNIVKENLRWGRKA